MRMNMNNFLYSPIEFFNLNEWKKSRWFWALQCSFFTLFFWSNKAIFLRPVSDDIYSMSSMIFLNDNLRRFCWRDRRNVWLLVTAFWKKLPHSVFSKNCRWVSFDHLVRLADDKDDDDDDEEEAKRGQLEGRTKNIGARETRKKRINKQSLYQSDWKMESSSSCSFCFTHNNSFFICY